VASRGPEQRAAALAWALLRDVLRRHDAPFGGGGGGGAGLGAGLGARALASCLEADARVEPPPWLAAALSLGPRGRTFGGGGGAGGGGAGSGGAGAGGSSGAGARAEAGNPRALVEAYLEHGLLELACAAAAAWVAAASPRGGGALAAAALPDRGLAVCLPYALLDALLEACFVVIEEGNATSQLSLKVRRLEDAMEVNAGHETGDWFFCFV
jgi:hypothetical protein